MDVLVDFRVAARGLMRSKGFALASSLTLALGIAATTTIFSVVYGVLLRPLPYRDADRLVIIQGEKDFSTGPRLMNYSGPEMEDFTAATRVFESLAMMAATGFTLQDDAGADAINGATVSGTFFDTMGTAPIFGRLLGDENEPNIVISERYWRRKFSGSANVLGKTLTMADYTNNYHTYTIVGVAAQTFQYPYSRTDIWRTLKYARTTNDGNVNNRNGGGYTFIGRLRPGLTLADARRDAAAANDVLKPNFKNSRIDMRAKVITLEEFIKGTIGPSLWILMGAVSLVMLVACANVANLILARQSSRQREMSMRIALGAPRGRLIAYLLTESAMVATAGVTFGVGIAFGAVRLLQWLQPSQLPRLDAIELDVPVLIFAITLAAVALLLAGLGPAVMSTRTDLMLAMRAASRTVVGAPARVRAALVVIEIAVSIVLLVGAALLGRTLFALIETDLGVNMEHVITAHLDLGMGRQLSVEHQAEITDALLQRVSAIPGVSSAAFGSGVPPNVEFQRASFVLSDVSHIVTMVPVTGEYFSTLRIPLLKGRYFNASDHADVAKVMSVIISRETATRFFGNDEPLGKTLPMGGDQMTVIGVVEDVKYSGVANKAEPVMYRPFSQSPFRVVVLFARSTGDPLAIAGELRQVIRTYDRDINIASIQPLTTWLSNAVAQPRFRAILLTSIAAITLILAMVGLYGVIAYSTTRRTAEIGLRVAIGAQRGDVIRLVLLEGFRLAVLGVIAGVAGAYWTTRLLSTFLYQVAPTDVTAFVASALVLLIVAMVATYLPARRAARIDPMTALRAE